MTLLAVLALALVALAAPVFAQAPDASPTAPPAAPEPATLAPETAAPPATGPATDVPEGAEATASPAANAVSAPTDGPVARGVFFFSPTCPHCELVITDHLPGIFEQYGGEPTIAIDESLEPTDVSFYLMSNGTLQLLMVDASVDPGARLFVTDSERLGIDNAGVPRLDIAGRYLVGSLDIPEQLPGIIRDALAAEGIDWPPIPGLGDALAPFPEAGHTPSSGAAPDGLPAELPASAKASVLDRVSSDPLGNGISIIVLVALIVSLVAVPVLAYRGGLAELPSWPIPLLAVVGIAVSSYLGSIESSGTEAVCGPVGDCNAVQDSEYAQLLGVPIGVLGVLGYSVLLAGWVISRLVHGRMADWALVFVALGAFGGTLFSTYLTFLEPFVIGATCMWCITSALTMLGLMWLTAGRGWAAWQRLRAD